jgi:aminopeptidase
MDQRIQQLASNLVNYSLNVQPGEKVLIEHIGSSTKDLARQLVIEVYKAKGIPFIESTDPRLERELILQAPDEYFNLRTHWESERMKLMDCYIGVRGSDNVSEMADVPSEQLSKYQRLWQKPVHSELRVKGTRWVVLRYPNPSMAQLSNTSQSAFEDFYFNVCNLDYSKMSKAMDSLVELMDNTDKVRIEGVGTDLTFSIKDIPSVKCAGEMNIPDGEVFTAPVKNSINGTLTYNTPAVYQGFTYENIQLTFENGKIVAATANNTERINNVFDTDDGARYIGEFAIGVNPYVLKPMKDTLFDEKIMGSFHFTPGQAYDEADNTNRSAIHWDLVCIQTPEYGGGKIYFDDVLIRENGLFVLDELRCLNPENLK